MRNGNFLKTKYNRIEHEQKRHCIHCVKVKLRITREDYVSKIYMQKPSKMVNSERECESPHYEVKIAQSPIIFLIFAFYVPQFTQIEHSLSAL